MCGKQVPLVAALRHNDAWHLSQGLASAEEAFPIAAPAPADSEESDSMAGASSPHAQQMRHAVMCLYSCLLSVAAYEAPQL